MLIEPESSPPSLSVNTEAALRDIAESLGLRLLVVFGSLAAGRGNAASDLDIGVLSGGVPATAVELRVLEHGLHPRPDVVDLARCSALLALVVARTARVVYEAAPGVFASFASLALRRHEDARRFREADRAVIARFVSVHGGSP